MSIRSVGFAIKIPLARETTATQKAIDKQKKTLVDMHKKDLPQLTKKTKEYLASTRKGFQDAERASERMGRAFASSMGDGLRALNKFDRGLTGTIGKIANLKTALAGTAIGAAAIWGGRKLFQGGKAQLATRARISREFGSEAGFLEGVAGKAGKAAGLSDDDAIKGLIPLREQLDAIQEGKTFRGMRKPLTALGAKALREKNLTFGAGLYSRVSALAPDLDKDDIGRVLGDALSGPDGIRRLVSEFNLHKDSKDVSQANEKGDVFKLLREDEKKRYGVKKHGDFLEQGDLVNVMLERSGLTNAAADDQRKKLSFQIKQIGATAENALADIGSHALDKFNSGIGKGASLAERFEAALKSKEGKRVLDGISDTVTNIAEGAVKVATELPRIGSFLSEHKTTLLALGGAFVALKGASAIGGMLGNAKQIPGVGGALGGLFGKGAPVPVYVVNQPGAPGIPGSGGAPLGWGKKLLGVAGAGGVGSGLLLAAAGATAAYGGYKAGDYLGKHVKPIGKMHDAEANWLYRLTGEADADKKTENFEVDRNVKQLAARAAANKSRVAALEAQGYSHGEAVRYAEHPSEKREPAQTIQTSIAINIDGKKVADAVTQHQVRKIKNDTANGAAPTHRE